MSSYFGGIEAGGTKFVCMVAGGPDDILAEDRFLTTTPQETIQRAVQFFEPFANQINGIGIATFGPVDLNPGSPTFGFITSTPKKGWARTDIYGEIKRAFNIPVAIDTDVNGAALAEHDWDPINELLDPFIYITIGTGIGMGIIANGKPLHGLVHPEAGHLLIPHDRLVDPFPGCCPYHGDCLEGLASGPAMARRWGQKAETLPHDHPAWDLETQYIGLAVSNLMLSISPQKIVIGGGVSQHPGFHQAVCQKVQTILNGYVQSPGILKDIEKLIVPPSLGNRAGVLGAVALIKSALG